MDTHREECEALVDLEGGVGKAASGEDAWLDTHHFTAGAGALLILLESLTGLCALLSWSDGSLAPALYPARIRRARLQILFYSTRTVHTVNIIYAVFITSLITSVIFGDNTRMI